MSLLRQLEEFLYRHPPPNSGGVCLEEPNGDVLSRLWICIPRLHQVLRENSGLVKPTYRISFEFGRPPFRRPSIICLPPRRMSEWPQMIRRLQGG